MDGEPVELVNVRLIATVEVEKPELREEDPPEDDGERSTREANIDGEWVETTVLRRAALGRGSRLEGPAVVEFAEATCLVRPGWAGTIDDVGTLVLERDE